ncbi:MAG: carboxymuconolactone decarboxylase family protein [Rhodobacterales bacterium]|nr:carboxymuconolactone decarboxylase family protein [Rhodobacterales bacterium]
MSRPDYTKTAPDLTRKLLSFTRALRDTTIDDTLRELINVRVSQMNGCAYCVDTHIRHAKGFGETDTRLHALAVWRDSPLFDAREKAALLWAETLTHLPTGGVPDATYTVAQARFDDRSLAELTFIVITINAWNRASVAFRLIPAHTDPA